MRAMTETILPPGRKRLGTVIQVLLPSLKMKSHSVRGVPYASEFHAFLISRYGGYTVASGSITGYWLRSNQEEECNEHREYQIALKDQKALEGLSEYLSALARELSERTIYCQANGEAFIIEALPSNGKTRRKERNTSRPGLRNSELMNRKWRKARKSEASGNHAHKE